MTTAKTKPQVSTTPAAESKPAAPVRRRRAPATAASPAPKQNVPPAQAAMAKKAEKGVKKEKRVRSSFGMPESQFLLLAELKARCLSFGINAKKGELLAAGLELLKNLPETSLEASVLPFLRADRKPAKAKKRKK